MRRAMHQASGADCPRGLGAVPRAFRRRLAAEFVICCDLARSWTEISDCIKELERRRAHAATGAKGTPSWRILPLHSMVPPHEQARASASGRWPPRQQKHSLPPSPRCTCVRLAPPQCLSRATHPPTVRRARLAHGSWRRCAPERCTAAPPVGRATAALPMRSARCSRRTARSGRSSSRRTSRRRPSRSMTSCARHACAHTRTRIRARARARRRSITAKHDRWLRVYVGRTPPRRIGPTDASIESPRTHSPCACACARARTLRVSRR
jgi:hypothetical protein